MEGGNHLSNLFWDIFLGGSFLYNTATKQNTAPRCPLHACFAMPAFAALPACTHTRLPALLSLLLSSSLLCAAPALLLYYLHLPMHAILPCCFAPLFALLPCHCMPCACHTPLSHACLSLLVYLSSFFYPMLPTLPYACICHTWHITLCFLLFPTPFAAQHMPVRTQKHCLLSLTSYLLSCFSFHHAPACMCFL